MSRCRSHHGSLRGIHVRLRGDHRLGGVRLEVNDRRVEAEDPRQQPLDVNQLSGVSGCVNPRKGGVIAMSRWSAVDRAGHIPVHAFR
jgi:hypothetical protein